MNHFKSLIAFLLAAAMLFLLCGCFDTSYIDNTQDELTSSAPAAENISVEDIDLHLSYSVSDSFHPFQATTEMNQALTPLMYDGLFAVDNTFRAAALIAGSYLQTTDAIKVVIKREATFTDGSPVTADDVVYSFQEAKKSDRYKNQLSCFKDAQAISADTAAFQFAAPVRDAVNLLTFPIIKTDSDHPDSEDKFDLPIGCGRYKLTLDENNVPYLACFASRLGKYMPIYKNIGLVAVTDNETIGSAFALGQSNVLIDTFSTGEYTQSIGTTKLLPLPNTVYLAFNKNKAVLQDPAVRKAISYAIDRKELADYSFISFAKPAYTPLHPDSYQLKNQTIDKTHSVIRAKSLLDAAGYTEVNESYHMRYAKDAPGKNLEFNLAVCSDNAFKVSAAEKIKEQLEKADIRITIYKYEEKAFLNAVANGRYDIYIGECKLKNNLDLSEFFDIRSTVSSGIDTNGDCAKAYQSYQKGETDISGFLAAYYKELPYLPLLYRCGCITSNVAMKVPAEPIVTDVYSNSEKWTPANDQ